MKYINTFKNHASYEEKLNLLEKSFKQEVIINNLLNELKEKYSITKEDYEKYKSILEEL